MFDLAGVLAGVAGADGGREQITYLDPSLIVPDQNNFYSMEGIEELAGNIELIGLQQPLRVRRAPQGEVFILVSGHRRREAILRILADRPDAFPDGIPCIIEQGEASEAMRELRLIYANAATRDMSAADLSRQAERVEELLYRLKEEGVEFPGRMRDHVAEACKVSKTKLARLHAIRSKLDPELLKFFDRGELNETAAYEIAKRPVDVQKLAAQRLGPKVLAGMTTDRVIACLEACEADGNREREAVEDRNRNVSRMAEAAGNSVLDDYREKMLEEDGVLRRLCRDNIGKILCDLMFYKDDYDFSENYRVPNIDRMRKHDPHSSYTCSWNANDGTGTWIDWDSKGIRVVTGGRAFRRTWTDFYDALTGAALQQAWKAKNDRESGAEPKAVSGTDTGWQTGTPKDKGSYAIVCGVPKDLTPGSYMQKIMDWDGEGWSDGRGVPLRLNVYEWLKLPEV